MYNEWIFERVNNLNMERKVLIQFPQTQLNCSECKITQHWNTRNEKKRKKYISVDKAK